MVIKSQVESGERKSNGDADANDGGRGAGGGELAGGARDGAVAEPAELRGEAGPVRAVHERDGHASGHLLHAAQGGREERPEVPLRPLRLAGDLQGLQHQPHRRPPPLQAMRAQRHHQQLPRQFSYEVSSRFSIRWQQCPSSYYLSRFLRVDEFVPNFVVCIGIRIQHARDVFSYPTLDDLYL